MKGSCHCGAVAYEFNGRVLRFANCHCDDCRKVSGSPFSSAMVLEAAGFVITRGQDGLAEYQSSPGKYRCFCRNCGSPVYARMDYKPEIVIIRAGTVDDGLEVEPQMHIWVKARVPWYRIQDDLPQYPGAFS